LTEAELRSVFVDVKKFLTPFVDTDIIYVMVPVGESWDRIWFYLRIRLRRARSLIALSHLPRRL
jgi:hypothetical protein